MNNKRILFISQRFHTNESIMIKKLIENKYEIKYIVNESKYSEDHRFLKPLIIGYSKVCSLLKNDAQRTKYGFPPISILKLINDISPQIIIIKGLRYSTLLLSILLRFKKYKVIISAQKPLYTSKENLIKRIYYRAFGPIVITPVLGNRTKDTQERNQHMFGQRWIYLPFVSELASRSKVKKYFENGNVNFLVVAKYTKRKKILECLDVLTNVHKKYPEIFVTVIGTVLEDEIYRKAKEYEKNTDFIKIYRDIPHEKMDDYFYENDILIMPSIREAASYSQLEAMAYGLAIICSDDNGTAHYVKSGINGYIFDSKNYLESLYESILKVLTSKANIERMGKASLEQISSEHSIEGYIKLFNNI